VASKGVTPVSEVPFTARYGCYICRARWNGVHAVHCLYCCQTWGSHLIYRWHRSGDQIGALRVGESWTVPKVPVPSQ
jgi:hypothetical protein